MTERTTSAAVTPSALRIISTLYRRFRAEIGCLRWFRFQKLPAISNVVRRRSEHFVPGVEESGIERLHSHKRAGPRGTMTDWHDGGEPKEGWKQHGGEPPGREKPAGCERRQNIDQNEDCV